MNLEKLFKIQAELDKRILDKHNLHGEDLLDKKILALQVELGELANEFRGFKFWSEDQKARTETQCHACEGKGFFDFTTPFSNEHFTEECEYCGGTGIQENKNPLLEEYVDCLHFILTIGLELSMNKINLYIARVQMDDDVVTLFNEIFSDASELRFKALYSAEKRLAYESFLNTFVSLGKALGFTWEQIEQTYLEKNKINHARQENGY